MSSIESPRLNTEAFPKVREIIRPDGTKRIIKIHKTLVPEQTEEDQIEANISILKPQDVAGLFEMVKTKAAETVVFKAPHPNGKVSAPKELQKTLV